MWKKVTWVIVLLLAIGTIAPIGSGFWVAHQLKKRLQVEIQGQYRPLLFRPAFIIKDVRLAWREKVKIDSGEIKVSYDIFSLIPGRLLRVQISGTNLVGELEGDWAKIENIQQVKFLNVYADLGIGKRGLRDIFQLDAKAPNMEFHIGKTDKVLPSTRQDTGNHR